MEIILFMIAISAAILFGIFLMTAPLKAFEIQKKFYAMINWRIEPISLEKEIRNTRVMGLFLLVCTAAACLYYGLNYIR